MFLLVAISGFPRALCASSQRDQEIEQIREATSMVASGILDPGNIIVVGETRLDNLMRNVSPEDQLKISPVWTTLGLAAVAPIAVLRGKGISNNLIWVQMDPFRLRSREQYFFHVPKLSQEGVWIFFLKPVNKLPRAMSLDTSKLSKEIFQTDNATSPHALAEDLKFNLWFNQQTWFELAYDFSAFRIAGKNIRDLPLPDSLSQIARDQIVADNQRIRQVQQQKKPSPREFLLTEEQVIEIEKLTKLFENPNQPPTIEELLALKSDFSDAILRELAKTATPDLDGGLRKFKESIPKGVLEEIFKSE